MNDIISKLKYGQCHVKYCPKNDLEKKDINVINNVLKKLKIKPSYEWYKNEWLRLAVVHPETKQIFVFEQEEFIEYHPIQKASHIENELALAEKTKENLPVGILTNA